MGNDEKPHVEKISEAGAKAKGAAAEWWHLVTAEKRPKPNPKNFVQVKDLPLYSEDSTKTPYKFVPAEPLPGESVIAEIRKGFSHEYDRFASKFHLVDKAVNKTQNAVSKANQYVNEEWTVLPKAGAITVGGMAGFVLGLKRGFLGRTFYTTVGFLTMAAFCYPQETIDIIRTGIAHSEQTWESFKASPEPPKKKHDFSPPK